MSKALELVEQFSCASGLKLNGSKCEFMSIHDMDDIFLGGIPVKKSVKYLGIHITKNAISRHHLNFSDKIKKTKQIFNLWLQRDISLYGRVLLSKVEGLSRFVYSALSLFVNDKAIKEINKIFLDFIWKNRPYKLKREVLANSRSEGGLDFLDFADTVNTFKVNWLRRCLMNPMSLWFFIPNNLFDKLGGLSFLLKCNLLPGKLPISLSNFHQQCLLSWKLCFVHGFSPHKALLWNNADITIRNKSLFFPRWFNNNFNFILSVFDDFGNILTYEQFMNLHNFPVPLKEYNTLMRAIPVGLTQLMKSHLKFSKGYSFYPALPEVESNELHLLALL